MFEYFVHPETKYKYRLRGKLERAIRNSVGNAFLKIVNYRETRKSRALNTYIDEIISESKDTAFIAFLVQKHFHINRAIPCCCKNITKEKDYQRKRFLKVLGYWEAEYKKDTTLKNKLDKEYPNDCSTDAQLEMVKDSEDQDGSYENK